MVHVADLIKRRFVNIPRLMLQWFAPSAIVNIIIWSHEKYTNAIVFACSERKKRAIEIVANLNCLSARWKQWPQHRFHFLKKKSCCTFLLPNYARADHPFARLNPIVCNIFVTHFLPRRDLVLRAGDEIPRYKCTKQIFLYHKTHHVQISKDGDFLSP